MTSLLQFTLDLFSLDFSSAAPRPQVSPPVRPKKRQAPRNTLPAADLWSTVPAPSLLVAPVTEGTPCAPAVSLAQVLTPVSYRHPEATRELMLSGVHVAYAFKRGKRRTIGFSVGAEGLAVSAPKWVPLYEVDKAVHGKSDWILRKLQETRERQGRMDATRVDWRDGAQLPYLGQPLRVELDPGHHFKGAGTQLVGEPGAQRLLLGLPRSATPEQIRDAAQAWLMRQAKPLFEQRLNHFAPQLQVSWSRLSLSSAATRWGSAKSDGSIRLHWRLIHFGQDVIDYVVVHELSHLRVMDHSPRFWDTVATVVPNYDELRGQLKDLPIPSW